MTNNIEILAMVVAVNACVLGLGAVALVLLNRAVDRFDRSSQPAQLSAPAAPRHRGQRTTGEG